MALLIEAWSSKSARTMREYETLAEDISVDVDHDDSQTSSHSYSGVQRVGGAPTLMALDAPQWLVHVGGAEVFGPVSARQVAEAMKLGRLPADASIQAVGEVFWTGLYDEPTVVAALQAI